MDFEANRLEKKNEEEEEEEVGLLWRAELALTHINVKTYYGIRGKRRGACTIPHLCSEVGPFLHHFSC